ncbi:MAG: Gfo/Idh/MocA family oxidoreductase [Actinomycetota bacterium]
MTVRVGFLGAGNIARYHARMVGDAIGSDGIDARIVAVHDPADDGRSDRFVDDTGAEAVGSVDELVRRSDAVYVCTWTATHRQLVGAAVADGRAVFCEKPLDVDLATSQLVRDLLVDSGVTHQVGLVLRRSPAFNVLRERVVDAEAGAPMAVLFRDDQYLPTQGAYASTWRGDRVLAGSGVLMEHSIHDIDLLEWMLGPIVRVHATTAGHHEIVGIEDVATVSLQFASGVSGALITVWHDVLSRPSQRLVEVISRRRVSHLDGEWTGTVRWQDAEGGGELIDDELLQHARLHHPEAANPDRAFLEAVAAGRPSSPDADDALRAHVVLDAAYRSAATGLPVDVGPTSSVREPSSDR